MNPSNCKKENYLQVGRATKCGHCYPNEFGEGLREAEKLIKDFKCECICHGSEPITKTQEGVYKESKDLCWCDEAECKCGINPNPFALSHSRGISAGTHKPDSWEERLTELLDKVYGYIHQRGHKEIINQVSQLLDTTRQEGKNEILGGGRMKHFIETELDQAKQEAYQKGLDEAPVYVLESKIKEIKEKTLAEVKDRIEEVFLADEFIGFTDKEWKAIKRFWPLLKTLL